MTRYEGSNFGYRRLKGQLAAGYGRLGGRAGGAAIRIAPEISLGQTAVPTDLLL